MKEGKHRETGQWEVINHRRRPLASAVVPREQGSSIRSAADGAAIGDRAHLIGLVLFVFCGV